MKIIAGVEWIGYEYIAMLVIVFIVFELGVRTGQYQPSENSVMVKGCINREGACWEGKLQTDGGDWEAVEVVETPNCSDCGTRLIRQNTDTISMPTYWECPECRINIPNSERESVIRQFERHFRNIIDGDENSLEKHDNHDSEFQTPELIWKEYMTTQDDDDISECCIVN